VLLTAVVVVGVAVVLVLTLPGLLKGNQADDPPVYVIAIDAGHGGRDPGATDGDVYEKDINLEIANRLTALVDAEPDLVANQIRTLDMFIALPDRITQAQSAGATIYVTIHVNSYFNSDPDGIETIVDNTREVDSDNWVLAELIQDSVVEATGARDRGAKAQESYLQRATIPAVSVETGYITNPTERAKLLDPEYQALLAQGIMDGIRQYMTWKYPPPPAEE